MASLNMVIFIGRLGYDISKKMVGEYPVVNNVLAISSFYKDKDGNTKEKTVWIDLTFWRKQAELVERYCKKGSLIYVDGEIDINAWEDKDQVKRQKIFVNVRNIQLLDQKSKRETKTEEKPVDVLEEDIPF